MSQVSPRNLKNNATILLAFALIALATIFADGKPTNQARRRRDLPKLNRDFHDINKDHDPLVALPSDYDRHEASPPEVETQEVTTMVTEYETSAATEVPPAGDQIGEVQQGHPKQKYQVVYEVRNEPQDYYATQPNEEKPCDQTNQSPSEPQSAPVASDGATESYPTELAYVDQYGRPVEAPEEQPAGGSVEPEAPKSAEVIMKNSGMAATILTEVPARDLTPEVLESLRRDYGVKIVATRDQPGGNLVLNCDDYPNLMGSLCGQTSHQEVSAPQTASQPGIVFDANYHAYTEMTPLYGAQDIYRSDSQESKSYAQPQNAPSTSEAVTSVRKSVSSGASEANKKDESAKVNPEQQRASVALVKKQQRQA